MKLLIFIHSLSSGGAERVTTNLANYWAEKGWNITVVTMTARSTDFYELHPAVERIALELAGDSGNVLTGLRQNLRRVTALRRTLRQIRPDIALAMMSTANVLLALAAWGLPKLRAIGSERIHPPQLRLSTRWEGLRRYTYGRLDAVTALTRETADWLKDHTGARRVPVIPNAAAWPLAAQAPRLITEMIGVADRSIVLAVGRLDKQKGFDWLIEAFAALAPKYRDWDLLILGEGAERRALENQVQAAGLGRRVFLPGRAGNIGEWYERVDLYVMSSRFEGFPNTLAEAMAHGLPVVSFDCDTGPRDIIRHEVDGLLVPPGDLVAMKSALERLMGDSALRTKFASRALEARERFSMERISGMWEELFAELR
ncbi:MAG: glycosyltransferase family 4 protein [Acidobacteriota bacterium]|nr:glycosyltransferase family 4 protein [Acidobacteriota bacterium]